MKTSRGLFKTGETSCKSLRMREAGLLSVESVPRDELFLKAKTGLPRGGRTFRTRPSSFHLPEQPDSGQSRSCPSANSTSSRTSSLCSLPREPQSPITGSFTTVGYKCTGEVLEWHLWLENQYFLVFLSNERQHSSSRPEAPLTWQRRESREGTPGFSREKCAASGRLLPELLKNTGVVLNVGGN